jgi:hypothetical protein
MGEYGQASAPTAKRYVMQKEMSKPIASVIAFPVLLLLLGCSEKQSGDDAKGKAELSRNGVARIVFELPGDDIGSHESQMKLEEIKAAILTNGIGEIASSGYGMGNMEVVVALNSDSSIEDVRRLVGQVYPDGKYRIQQTTK